MKDLWLIRHAESIANIGETTTTPREIPLSEKGRKQADDLAESVCERPDLIVRSPYVRARETSEPLIERYPDVTTETLLVQEFTYLSVSRCRGTNFQQRKPWVAEYWDRADPFYSDGDQAESFAELVGRCEKFVWEMNQREFELAFVFTHEQFIKCLIWQSMALAPDITSAAMRSFQRFMTSFSIPNVGIVRLKIDDDGQFYFGRIDVSHN